jgi:hypothetical protein
MPGYRALSSSFVGSAADSAREAESLRRDGDSVTAITLLEEALAASERTAPQLPGWLCGRLAALYRTVGRYDDEVALLERYRESQTSEEARSRYDARLSKARTIAERKRRSDSGALLSVRKVLGTPRRRGTPVNSAAIQPAATNDFQHLCRQVLAVPAGEPEAEFEARLDAMMIPQCAAARAAGVPVEQLVQSLKAAAREAALLPGSGERDGRYSTALLRLLAAYFEDADR